MKTISTLCIILFASAQLAFSQGCVAVRHMSCTAPNANNSADFFKQKRGTWQVNVGYRYFQSFRHFVGDVEQTQRIADGTQVINTSHAMDVGITYMPNPRLSLSVNLPIQSNDRSSLYEHYGNTLTANPEQKRFHTKSQGIGDMRVSASYWVRNPLTAPKFNFAVGVGVKFPTGNAGVEDDFHKLDKEKKDYTIRKPVDQSIQLGDGAVGFNVDLQGYYAFNKTLTLYFNGFYLFNPKEVNSVKRDPTSTATDASAYFSVADQFAARLGVSQALPFAKGFAVMLGGRAEGVPAIDAFGGSDGFRRPGYILSVEPGVSYMKGRFSAAVTVPWALYRNRTKSYADRQDPTGQKHGDAAFADYLISANISRWF
ncbi:MAG: hypothetical protein U0Y10_12035 [Spirosomataceae bacterium]